MKNKSAALNASQNLLKDFKKHVFRSTTNNVRWVVMQQWHQHKLSFNAWTEIGLRSQFSQICKYLEFTSNRVLHFTCRLVLLLACFLFEYDHCTEVYRIAGAGDYYMIRFLRPLTRSNRVDSSLSMIQVWSSELLLDILIQLDINSYSPSDVHINT